MCYYSYIFRKKSTQFINILQALIHLNTIIFYDILQIGLRATTELGFKCTICIIFIKLSEVAILTSAMENLLLHTQRENTTLHNIHTCISTDWRDSLPSFEPYSSQVLIMNIYKIKL